MSSFTCCSQFLRGRPGGRFQSAVGGMPMWASIDSCSACKAGVFSGRQQMWPSTTLHVNAKWSKTWVSITLTFPCSEQTGHPVWHNVHSQYHSCATQKCSALLYFQVLSQQCACKEASKRFVNSRPQLYDNLPLPVPIFFSLVCLVTEEQGCKKVTKVVVQQLPNQELNPQLFLESSAVPLCHYATSSAVPLCHYATSSAVPLCHYATSSAVPLCHYATSSAVPLCHYATSSAVPLCHYATSSAVLLCHYATSSAVPLCHYATSSAVPLCHYATSSAVLLCHYATSSAVPLCHYATGD